MTKLSIIPKSVVNLTDKELGRQLVDQYRAACSGMGEYIAFGALAANAKLRIDSARGVDSPADGRGAKGTGFKAWLKDYTDGEISEPTAYRYIDLAEIVRDEMAIGQRVDLYHVLKGENLEAKETKLREKIAAFVAGKSQRQLLIDAGQFEPPAAPTRSKKETEEQRHARLVEAARFNALTTFSAFDTLGERWMLVDDGQLQVAVENAKKFSKEAEAWLKTPPDKRVQFRVKTLLGQEGEL